MSISEIERKYNDGEYTISVPDIKRLPDWHVFDENKSVKWNREAVAEYNKLANKQREEAIKLRAKKNSQFHMDICDYICHEYNLSMRQAELIENYVYEEKHSCMSDYFIAIDEIAELSKRIVSSKESYFGNPFDDKKIMHYYALLSQDSEILLFKKAGIQRGSKLYNGDNFVKMYKQTCKEYPINELTSDLLRVYTHTDVNEYKALIIEMLELMGTNKFRKVPDVSFSKVAVNIFVHRDGDYIVQLLADDSLAENIEPRKYAVDVLRWAVENFDFVPVHIEKRRH